MSLLLSALLAQTVPMETEEARAARRCAVADLVVGNANTDDLPMVISFLYHMSRIVAAGELAAKPVAQLRDATAQTIAGADMPVDEARRVRGECMARYPHSVSAEAAILPPEAERRDLLCSATYRFAGELARDWPALTSELTDLPNYARRAQAMEKRMLDAAPAEEKEALEYRQESELVLSSRRGNLRMTLRGCEAAGIVG